MARAPLFGVFILALCLVACVCAHGEETVTKETAKADAKAAQESAKNVFDKATEEKGKAEELLKNINTYKEKADAAEKAAEAAKTAKTIKDAESLVQKAKTASDELVKLRDDPSKGVQGVVDKMTKLLKEATDFQTKATTLLKSVETDTNYKKIKEDADKIKTDVGNLDTEINAETPKITNAKTSATTAEQTVKDINKVLKPDTTDTNEPDKNKAKDVPKNEEPKNPDVTQGIDKVIPQVTTGGPAGSGVTEPTKPSSSDSAMTVSVPLLMALIACAALQ